jgi:hypothetical protein
MPNKPTKHFIKLTKHHISHKALDLDLEMEKSKL